MQVLQRKKHLSHVIGHILLHSGVVLLYLTEEGAALNVLQLKIEVLLILETTVDVHEERALRGQVQFWIIWILVLLIQDEVLILITEVLEHLSLIDDVVNVLHCSHTLLFQYLECTQPIALFIECFMNFAKVSDSNYLHKVKI